jgi:hypothetical protein
MAPPGRLIIGRADRQSSDGPRILAAEEAVETGEGAMADLGEFGSQNTEARIAEPDPPPISARAVPAGMLGGELAGTFPVPHVLERVLWYFLRSDVLGVSASSDEVEYVYTTYSAAVQSVS